MKKLNSLLTKIKEKFSFAKVNFERRFRMLFSLGLASAAGQKLFAADKIESLDNNASAILKIITGTPLKVVLVIAVIVCFGCIAWGQSQGEGGMFKKVLPIIVGCVGIASAVGIVTVLLGNGSYEIK